jgi:hypothetical protein
VASKPGGRCMSMKQNRIVFGFRVSGFGLARSFNKIRIDP